MKEPTIIYEDNNILAINKPFGMSVHGDGRTNEATIADWILKKYPKLVNVGELFYKSIISNQKSIIIPRPGIVHRLDKDTSGVLLVAKNKDTYFFLKKQFKNRTIKKTYYAIVYGVFKVDEGVIDVPIGRSTTDFRRRTTVSHSMRGEVREAVTKYKVLARSEQYSFLKITPKTGRTHQIRVHMKEDGHPVVCDTLYAPRRVCPVLLGRLALHAYAIECEVPQEGILRIEAPLPEDMQKFAKVEFPELQVE